MIKLEIVAVGDSLGVVLPSEVLSRLGLNLGDALYTIETLHGIELSVDKEFAEDMRVAEAVMRQDRDVLRKLAQ